MVEQNALAALELSDRSYVMEQGASASPALARRSWTIRTCRRRISAAEAMAYDLHVVRTKDWLEASSAPITKEDVDALIASDPELEWSTSDYIDMAMTQEQSRATT